MSIIYKEINLEQGTFEWKEWRRGGFGASDAVKVMRKDLSMSIDQLLREKISGGRDYQNDAMRRGIELEPEARKAYSKKVGFEVKPVCLQHLECPWIRASVDGMSNDRKRIVEIKCGERTFEHACCGKIPSNYKAQLQHLLLITGLDVIDYWCYDPDGGGVLMKIKRDHVYISKLKTRLGQVGTRMIEVKGNLGAVGVSGIEKQRQTAREAAPKVQRPSHSDTPAESKTDWGTVLFWAVVVFALISALRD